ncbi:MAG: GGDEF domain-containing protein, partial [Gemmatimonadaceae bacterium]|nr:GGDEF domain-containing protein [Acetobacteraceae bacterium]
RGDVLDHILGQMRQEVLAPRMMQAVLDGAVRAMGGTGAAVLDLTQGAEGTVLHRSDADPAHIVGDAVALLHDHNDALVQSAVVPAAMILACTASTRFGERAGLVVWRPPDTRPWDADDRTLAASVTGVIRIVLEHESIQRELARQARTDPLTGLLNRRAFLTEAARRIDRLDREGLPGTLLFVDLDRLKPLNDRLGHEAGDAALVLAADLLYRTVRPTDLVARLGGDEFALWLDGSDELTAAERAEGLRQGCPAMLAHLAAGPDPADQITMSIGIACRRPGGGEDLDSLIARADQAMYEVKHAGRGHWRVSQTGPGA